jgi:hypothetical protein
MGFGIDSFVNDVLSSNLVKNIFGNPIWSSIIIVAVVLIIIYFVFAEPYNDMRDETDRDDFDSSFIRLLLRAGVYTTAFVLGLTFMHYQTVVREFERRGENKLLGETVQGATGINIVGGPGVAGAGERLGVVQVVPVAQGTPISQVVQTTSNMQNLPKLEIFETKPFVNPAAALVKN